MKAMITLTLVFGTIGPAALSMAQENGGQSAPSTENAPATENTQAPRQHHRFWLHGVLKQLDLTDAQKDQVRGIVKESFPKMRELRQQIRAARQNDETADLSNLFAQMKSDRQSLVASIKGVLTQEQSEKFDSIMAERAQRWKERHEQAGQSAN